MQTSVADFFIYDIRELWQNNMKQFMGEIFYGDSNCQKGMYILVIDSLTYVEEKRNYCL